MRAPSSPLSADGDLARPLQDIESRKKIKCKIFFGYTSNMVSCGVRENIRFLAQHKMVRARLLR